MLLGLVMALAGCGGDENKEGGGTEGGTTGGSTGGTTSPGTGAAPSAGGMQLTGAGATFPAALYSKWFDLYKSKGVQINYQALGSGAGIQQLKNRTVDFGASDAPLSDKEAGEMPKPVVQIPTTAGGVVLTYNVPGLETGLKLTPEAIAGIFLGTVKKWNDPLIAKENADRKLPDTPILVVHRSEGSGTTFLFTSYLAAVSPEWKSKVGAGKEVRWPVGQGGKGSDGVTAVVKQTPGAVGYVELIYATKNKLAYASVKNASGQFVEPTVQSVTAAIAASADALKKDIRTPIINSKGAQAYPIAGLTYMLLYREQDDSAKGKAIVDFLTWAIHDGQKETEPLLFSPLPPDIVTANEESLKKVMVQGKPVQ
jgi:phosphate transport system substrate-binding protein